MTSLILYRSFTAILARKLSLAIPVPLTASRVFAREWHFPFPKELEVEDNPNQNEILSLQGR